MRNHEDALLRIENLSQHFRVGGGLFGRSNIVYAVDDVSLEVQAGETLGIVGESGCGKSTLGRALLKLYQPTAGKIYFEGKDITQYSSSNMAPLRQHLQIIFQDPMESLNARHTVAQILSEPFEIHSIGTKGERGRWVCELLEKVGLPATAATLYPHEFSGGQRQRIGIARAIALKPKVIVCDEAVSALDVSVQAQVINLLLDLQKEMNLALIFIAHDLSVVKHISDRIAVMYLGKFVEVAQADELYETPKHPYTKALISAIPIPNPRKRSERLILQGDVPSPMNPPSGCNFHPRCPIATGRCGKQEPNLKILPSSSLEERQVSCHEVSK